MYKKGAFTKYYSFGRVYLLKLITLFGPEKLFIFEFVFNSFVDLLEVTYLRHELPNNSHVRLVLLLAILHVMIEKVVIWLENRHAGNLDPTEWNA